MYNNVFMDAAFAEATKAFIEDEVPVGAVVVRGDEIIAKAYNKREGANKITAHAEIEVLEQAAQEIGTWKLNDCELYVTLEPCLMCYAAIKQSRIKTTYIANRGDIKKNYVYTKFLEEDPSFNYDHQDVRSKKLLEEFFKNKRRNYDN